MNFFNAKAISAGGRSRWRDRGLRSSILAAGPAHGLIAAALLLMCATPVWSQANLSIIPDTTAVCSASPTLYLVFQQPAAGNIFSVNFD